MSGDVVLNQGLSSGDQVLEPQQRRPTQSQATSLLQNNTLFGLKQTIMAIEH